MPRQHGNIFTPLAQRRQAQANHIEPVEQVLAESAVLHPLLQILMGGRNHPHIGFHRAMTAHPVEMAVAEHPQQPGLQVKRHIADLVQKQSATVGLLKAASAHGLGAGKGAALMAKQLGLQQVLRNGCSVDGHKRPVGTRRVLVQRTRHQLLARARFAGDHHRHVTLAQAANGPKNILHRWRLPQHLGRLGHALLDHLLAQTLFHRPANQFHRLGQVKGFGQVLKGTALEGRDCAVEV